MRPGEEKKIKATIKLLKYFSDKNINIGLVNEGIREQLTVKVDIIDSCDCKRKENSTLCSFSGTKRCGICECNEGRSVYFFYNSNITFINRLAVSCGFTHVNALCDYYK